MALRRFNRVLTTGSRLFRGFRYAGYCPFCESRTLFFQMGAWLREDLRCIRCRSSSRQRALALYLQQYFPSLEPLLIYEAGPAGPMGAWLEKRCGNYQTSQYFSDAPFGTRVNGYRNENLESLTFDQDSFDVVITQDVFEHIEQPQYAFCEVARVLKSGGSHVFTIPYYPDQPTQTRVRLVNGWPVSAFELEYHSNPIDAHGSLVFTRFDHDLNEMIFNASGMETSIQRMNEPMFGIEGESVIVFHSVKAGTEGFGT